MTWHIEKNEMESITYDIKLFLTGKQLNPPCTNKTEETLSVSLKK